MKTVYCLLLNSATNVHIAKLLAVESRYNLEDRLVLWLVGSGAAPQGEGRPPLSFAQEIEGKQRRKRKKEDEEEKKKKNEKKRVND